MTIHVGIVLYISTDDLPACFNALRNQTYTATRIYALDNGSADGGAEWMRQHAPDVRLILSTENVGFSAAHNRLLRGLMHRGVLHDDDYYLALNPDVRLAPDYLERLIADMRADPCIGWASGKLVYPLNGDPPGTPRRVYSAGHALLRNGYAFNIGLGMIDDAHLGGSREVFGVPAAAVLMRAAFIRDLWTDDSFYDETFFLYGEDTDVDWRGQRAGWRCWLDGDALAEHRGGLASPRFAAEAVANRYLSAFKNASASDRWMVITPLMIAHALARAILSPASGRWLIRALAHGLRSAWRRRNRAWHDPEMTRWFTWSQQQPTSEARTVSERWRTYTDRLKSPVELRRL